MDSRAFLVMVLVIFCFAQVFSDIKKVDKEILNSKQGYVRGGNGRHMHGIDCGVQCQRRCSRHSRPNRCLRACGTCCVRCHCVPPGTFGNRELCGRCYTEMTTHGNKAKCP